MGYLGGTNACGDCVRRGDCGGDQVTIHPGESGARLGEYRSLKSDDREVSHDLFPARRVRG
jgi:hypothetical protein